MGNTATLNFSTLSDYTALDPDINAQIWDKVIQRAINMKEQIAQFQGPEGSDKPIIEKQELSKGGGDQINFTVDSPLVGHGVQGASTLRGNEEKETFSTYTCLVDFRRHGLATDKRLDQFMAANNKTRAAMKVAEWMAWFKQMEGLMCLVKKGGYTTTGKANNLIRSGGKSTDDDIIDSNLLSTADFDSANVKLSVLGAQPVGLIDGEPEYVMWATPKMLRGLRSDTAWLTYNQQARPREGGAGTNPMLTGSFGSFYGIRTFVIRNPDHDNPKNGPIGNPLEPRALLRVATTTTTTTTISAGGTGATSTTALFFRDFPGYAYSWSTLSTDAESSDANTYYFKIINLPGSTYAGKCEVCSYTGSNNNGVTITSVTRAVNSTADDYTATHDVDSLIVPCNQSGVPYAHAVVLGRMALLRAYGAIREQTVFQEDDYGFVRGVAIESIFGQKPAQRADSKYPNFCLIRSAIDPLA